MDRRGDHESVIAGGRYGNRRQSASQPLAAARRERQWQTSVQSLPYIPPRTCSPVRSKRGRLTEACSSPSSADRWTTPPRCYNSHAWEYPPHTSYPNASGGTRMATLTLNRERRLGGGGRNARRQNSAEYVAIHPTENIVNHLKFDGKVFRPIDRRSRAVRSKRGS